MKDKRNDFVSITIPKKLFEKLSTKMRSANVETVSKYITYILEKQLSSEKENVFTKEEKEKIKNRLRSLGYF